MKYGFLQNSQKISTFDPLIYRCSHFKSHIFKDLQKALFNQKNIETLQIIILKCKDDSTNKKSCFIVVFNSFINQQLLQ